ncbi:MAG: hypothetical protein IJQ20_02125 [Paludibacteraceae bacterium]|nr:hypothetical protein [Paludibacteraceae bacterium]MBQ9602727.1 hypothetical protein [Paludibacteraceae bacterium]
MKKLEFLIAVIAAFAFTACNKKDQVSDEKLLIGTWEETNTLVEPQAYSFDGLYMRSVSEFYPSQEVWVYSLSRQDGKLVISFKGIVNEETGVVEEIGREPITIVKLNASELEWEYYIGVYPDPIMKQEQYKKIK